MQEKPATKEDRYPATVWSRYRNTGVPFIVVLGLLAALGGELLDLDWLHAYGMLAAVLGAVSLFPALVLEFRADMRYDRAHPADDTEVST